MLKSSYILIKEEQKAKEPNKQTDKEIHMLCNSDKNFFSRMMLIHKSEACNAQQKFRVDARTEIFV
jgi:hypothetical protein